MISNNKIKIYYYCEQNFINQWIRDIFEQKNIILSLRKDHNFSLKIDFKDNYLKFSINNYNKKNKVPITFQNLKNNIFDAMSTVKFEFKSFSYYPYLGIIQNSNMSVKLSENYNIILSNLFDNEDGIKKEKLYSCLWPSNKEYTINKLDTHLTNLKNFLKQNCSLDFQFKSQKGLLKLI